MSTTQTVPSFVPPYFFDQLERSGLKPQATSRKQEKFSLISSQNQKPPYADFLNQVKVSPKQDLEASSLKKNGAITLQFLKQKLNRASWDNSQSNLNIQLHDSNNSDNASWFNGTVYIGDVSKKNTATHTTFTKDIDILAHEVGHGVVQTTSQWAYSDITGALNESWSDVLGSMIKQFSKNQTAQNADWLIGDKLIKDLTGKKMALRSMKDPGSAYKFSETEKDLQVDHMDKVKQINFDDGGVHIYSGIPNKAFYLFAMSFPDQPSYRYAGRIWYNALYSSQRNTDTFEKFAIKTLEAANGFRLPSIIAHVDLKQLLSNAWEKVGINVPVTVVLTYPPPSSNHLVRSQNKHPLQRSIRSSRHKDDERYSGCEEQCSIQ